MDPSEVTTVAISPKAWQCLPSMTTELPMKHDDLIPEQTAEP